MVPISAGELIDKLTILEIKAERLADPDKRRNVVRERDALAAARDRAGLHGPAVEPFVADLKRVNEALWDIEDEIRACEAEQDFGPRFIELARSVYGTNDERAAIKKRLNLAVGSAYVEEKSYRGA